MDEEELYKLIAHLHNSKNPERILEYLIEEDKPLRPTDIAEELGINRASVSRRVSDMEDKGLVEVINPEDKRNRFYKITEKGRELLEKYRDEKD